MVTSYSWDNELGTGNNKEVTPTSTTIYNVTGTDDNGCTNTANITVTVNDLPTVAINSVEPICNGQSTTLTATGATSYSWDNDLGTGNNKEVTPTSTTTYSVTGTDDNGCSSNANITITVNDLPTIAFNPVNPICYGQSVTLTATGATNYSWDNDLGTGNNKEVTPTATTTYSVTGTDDNGCSSNADITITVNDLPTVLINGENPLAVEKCKNQDITLTASGASTYKWSGSGSTANPATFSAAGTYTVTGTDANGCEATAEVTITENTLAVSITETLVDCYTQAQGYVTYTVSGGHPQFQAVLVKDDVDGTPMTVGTGESQFYNGIAAGTYKIKVTEIGETQCTVVSDPVEVVFPTVTFTAPAAETFVLPYGVGEMNVTLEGTPTFTPTDGAFTYDNNLSELNPMGVGTHTVTWTLKDACSEMITSVPQTVNVVLPDCETAVELDGYNYPVVRVGYDCWFKENVKATTGIADVVAYDNDEASNKDKFGMLYTWHAAVANLNTAPESGSEEEPGSGPSSMMPMPIPPVDATERTQGICPEGWAIPTQEDFERLFINAGGDIAYLKDMDPTTWTTGKCGTAPSTGFNARGAGYYLSSIHDFNDLLSNTRFWTDKANAGETKATCCEFNYYCSEPMFKEVSAFDKLSVRCIKINTDELPTPPPTSDCPSLGATSLEIINPVVTGYGELVTATFRLTTEINDYDASKILDAFYFVDADDLTTPIEVNGTVSADGLVADIPFDEVIYFIDYTGLTITPVLTVNCDDPEGDNVLGDAWIFSDDCPEYTFYMAYYASPNMLGVTAEINHYDADAINFNQVSWTVTSDVATDAPYTFVSSGNTDYDAEYYHEATIGESSSDRSYQSAYLSMNIIHQNFPNATKLTFVPSMVVTCSGETKTVTGFALTFDLPTYDYTCPEVNSNQFEVTLVDGVYTAEIPFEGTIEGMSVTGVYFLTPYNASPNKQYFDGSMYDVTANHIVLIHIPENAYGLPVPLGDGQAIEFHISLGHGDCYPVSASGTYEAPATTECPIPDGGDFDITIDNDNYYAEISYTGGSGNEEVSGFYIISDGLEIGLHPYELMIDPAQQKIIVSIPTDIVSLDPGENLYVTIIINDGDMCEEQVEGSYYAEDEPVILECPEFNNNTFEVTKVNSYYASIPYSGGSSNTTVSGSYNVTGNPEEIELQLGESIWLNNQGDPSTVIVSIEFADLTLTPGEELNITVTLNDDNGCQTMITGTYTEPLGPSIIGNCPGLGTTTIAPGTNSTTFTVATPVTNLTNVSDATNYGYHIVAESTLLDNPIEITVDNNTTGVNVQLTTTELGVTVDLSSLVPADYAIYLPLLLQSDYLIAITPFITVTNTTCGDNGEVTGEQAVYPEP